MQTHAYWVIIASIIVALGLSVVALPFWAQWARPEWLVLVVLYWVIALPHRVGIITAWCAGLCLDVLANSVFGQHALALAIVAYIGQILYQRMRMFGFLQQAWLVFLMVMLYLVIGLWVQIFVADVQRVPLYFLPGLTSAFVWPIVYFSLRFVRRLFDVR